MSLGLPKGTQYELPPADTHTAVCYRIVDLGTQQGEYKGKVTRRHKIMLSWELNVMMTEGDNAGKPFSMHQRYTYGWSEKGTLRPTLEAWRGRPFTEQEMDDFKLCKLLGVGCLMGVVHETKDGSTYANISSIMKLPKGMEAPSLVNAPVDFDLGDFDQAIFDSFSDGLKATIALSPEYAKATGTSAKKGTQDETVMGHLNETPPYDDSEIPF